MKKFLSACLAILLVLSLTGCNNGGTADKPVKISSASGFSKWFGEGKKLSRMSGKTLYFQLSGNVKLKEEGLITGNNKVVLDLDGHSITAENARVFAVTDGSLHLKNGTVSSTGAPEDGGVLLLSGDGCALEATNMVLKNTDDTAIPERLQGGVIYANTPSGSQNSCQITLNGGTTVSGSTSGLRRAGGSIALASSLLYLQDATVENGKAGISGNIHADGNTQVYIQGGTVQNGSALHSNDMSGYGGNFYLQGLAAVYVREGSILGGIAEKSGGNFYLSNTAGEEAGLHFISGTMDGGSAKNEGGNIYAMDSASRVRIYGGEIGGGNAIMGGNIYLMSAPIDIYGGTLTGTANNTSLIQGGNIYGDKAEFTIYGGNVTSGMSMEYGGNIYVSDSTVDIYGGSITAGAVASQDVNRGGGNLYAGGGSTVRMYGGEISGGISNCMQDAESSAAGGNVMIGGTTRMEMCGGTIKDGTVYGKVTRGGSVYLYGQSHRNDVVFHMYGGLIENGLLENTMRGMCVASYSSTKTDIGDAVARLFGGEIRYTGAADNKNKVYAIFGNKSDKGDMYLFDPTPYEGLYSRTTAGPCADPSHNTQTGEVAATCLTQGCTEYTCQTCGVWYVITAEPLGHSETAEETELGTKHSCSTCGSIRYE